MRSFLTLAASLTLLGLTACATTPVPTQGENPLGNPNTQTQPPVTPEVTPEPEPWPPTTPPTQTPSPETPSPQPPTDTATPVLSEFDALSGWQGSDPSGALAAYRKACAIWDKRDAGSWLDTDLPHYGQISDWSQPCFAADYAGNDARSARQFFENYFLPVALVTDNGQAGLLTGYYEPEISVRRAADSVYSEPILSKPSSESALSLSRKDISASTAPVIGYGRPIDVFFMQVQGSGRIKFSDGTTQRAAFAAHNSRPYKSIGAVLVARGEMTLEQASKQSIEAWMTANGPAATRALMNENPRYIFFKTETIIPGEGPKGSMGAPLETMATVAVDNRHHPYGSLIWLDTVLPQYGGDYQGAPASLLVSAQDSGSAIKGPVRADLFFGSGDAAGAKAGVMKHPVTMTLLLPAGLAIRYLALS